MTITTTTMLSLAARRSHGVVQRLTTTIRTFSSAVPIVHSRNLPPPVCRDAAELKDLTAQLYEVKFVPYSMEQEEDVWETNDATIQMAEYTIRGHAACIPSTLWYDDSKQDETLSLPPETHVNAMQAIVQHLQQEGNNYMNLRRQLRSQVTEYDTDESSSSSSSSDEEDSSDDEEQDTPTDSNNKKAGPGPTVEMYDTLLDSMAVSALTTVSPRHYKDILEDVLLRHMQDGGPEINVNPYTFPTVLTFNAALRGVANTNYSSEANQEEIRDDALETAFGIYDEMRWHVDRNSATFQYMLFVVSKFLPPSRSRGNIAHGLWTQAKRHHVASSQVLEALHAAHSPSNGAEFDEWLQQHPADNIRKTPLDWRSQHKMKRYHRRSGTY